MVELSFSLTIWKREFAFCWREQVLLIDKDFEIGFL